MLHRKLTSSIYQTLFIFFSLSVGIATVMGTPLPPVSRSALQLERRDNSGVMTSLSLKIGRIIPNSDLRTWTWVSPANPALPFGKEALALCVGGRNCFAVWPNTNKALLHLSAFRLDPPKYSNQQSVNYMRLSTLGGKVNFKSPSFAKYGYLPEKSTIFKLLENVDEIAKQTELSITGDISYLSASLALLKNKGCLEDPAKTQEDWDKYKEKVEKNRLEQHKQREKEQHEKEQHKEEEQEAKAARQGNMGLNFILHP